MTTTAHIFEEVFEHGSLPTVVFDCEWSKSGSEVAAKPETEVQSVSLLAANRLARNLLGLSTFVPGVSLNDVVAPQSQRGLHDAIAAALCRGSVETILLKVKQPTAQCEVIEWRLMASDTTAGHARIIGELRAHPATKVTDERSARLFLDAIVENIPNMIFVKEAQDLSFVLFNTAAENLLGIPREQMYGKSDYDFFPKEQADFFTKADRKVFEGNSVVVISEEPIDTAKGQRWLHTKKVPLFDAEGIPAYLLGISEDITELRATRDALRARTEQLEQSNNDLTDFVYVASHDLSEPLRTVAGFAALISEELQPDASERMQSYLGFLTGGVTRMQTLLDALLQLSRAGKSAVRPTTVDLRRVVENAVAGLGAAIQEAGAKIDYGRLPTTQTDANLLELIVQNLLENAIKFRSERALLIKISARNKRGRVELLVRDNGIGFPQEKAAHIFQPLKRLHGVSQYAGAGIGLAICRRLVQALDGEIWAEGRPGIGATFVVSLPELSSVAGA